MIPVVAISAVALQMSCVAGLLALAIVAIVLSRSNRSTFVIYAATLAVCTVALFGAIRWLTGDTANATDLTLPIGLPWLGAHFRLDALAGFFLVVVNFGGAVASLYGLGYGRHDPAPHRVLPFFPAFLAGMNLWCWRTMPFPICCAGNSCRWPPGRWSWRTTASLATPGRAMSIW